MDIKDFILIGGGLLIAAVVAHGFWIAWRSRQEPLRIDIQPDLIPADVDDRDRLRGELPNGGARVVTSAAATEVLQEDFQLEPPPMLLEPTADPLMEPPAGRSGVRKDQRRERPTSGTTRSSGRKTEPQVVDDPAPAPQERATVAEVAMPDKPIVAETPTRGPRGKTERKAEPARDNTSRAQPVASAPVQPVAQELIVMNVLANPGQPFPGPALFEVLRGKGLKFGDMNIFHRVEPLTKAMHYSVANIVEPGTFDMADLDAVRAPGLCLFMQLPGPEHPMPAFEDMLDVARAVVAELGGEVKDEQRNVMTPQTVAHYRQRITDFSRRRMFKRA